MVCSLQCMASFFKQRNLGDHNGNNIPQPNQFRESTWSFISTIFESGWDQLDISGVTLFCDKVTLQLIKNKAPQLYSTNPNSTPIKKVSSLIPPCLTKDQLEKSKNYQTKQTAKGIIKPLLSKSFAQVTASVANILKLKKASPVLPDKKIIEIYNISVINFIWTITLGILDQFQRSNKGQATHQSFIQLQSPYSYHQRHQHEP